MNETLKYVVWALVTVGLFYGDLGTDVALLVDLVTVQKDLVLAAVVGGILILHVLVLSLYDMFAAGGLGLKGVVLNLTFTRVLYIVFSPSCKDTPYDDAKRTGQDAKLLEALLESTPQLYVQGVVLIRYTGSTSSGSFVILIVSLVFSVLSIAFSQAMKLNAMLGNTASHARYAGTVVYFLADALLRAVAFAAVFDTHGAYVAAWIGGWFVLDMIVIVYLSRFDSRSYRTKDIDGTGRDVNGTKAIANLQRGKEELDITNPDTRIRNIHICKIPTYHCGRKECHPMHPVVCYPFNLSSSNAEYQWPSDYNCLGPHDLTSEPWSPFQPEDAARCCDGVWCLQCTQCGTYEEADEFGGGEVDTINECWSVRACLVELNRFNVMLPVVWVVRLIAAPCVLVPNHPKEIGSAGLGLLSSMPLSSLDRDRLRLFVVPTIVNAAMMIFVAATAECVTLSATFAVAFGAAIVKIVSYCAAVHTMKRGQGATEAKGFTVFSLDVQGEGLMSSWSPEDWAAFFETEDNVTFDGYNDLTPPTIKALLDGAKIVTDAGRPCIGFGATSIRWRSKGAGDDGGETLAKMLKCNQTCISVDLGMSMCWRDAGKAFGEMLETNSTLKSLKLDKNNMAIDDKQKEASVAFLKGLRVNTTLDELFLQYSGFTSEDMEEMKASAGNNSIDLNWSKDGATNGSYLLEASHGDSNSNGSDGLKAEIETKM